MNEACPVCQKPLPKMPPSQRLTYCSRECAGVAKRRLMTVKICQVCGKEWRPMTRYQAARNKTCSPACLSASISQRRTGHATQPQIERVMVACRQCGAMTPRRPKQLGKSKDIYCSRSCRSKAYAGRLIPYASNGKGKRRPGKGLGGERNPAWKGGVTFKRDKGNYIGPKYVRCPADLMMMARADGYVMEHRLVMARWVKRPLTRTEAVHHLDHTTRNNARTNLELWPTNASHKAAEGGRCAPGVACRLFLTV